MFNFKINYSGSASKLNYTALVSYLYNIFCRRITDVFINSKLTKPKRQGKLAIINQILNFKRNDKVKRDAKKLVFIGKQEAGFQKF